jgi:hypothetical protein
MHNVFNEELLIAWRAISSGKNSDSLCSISLNNINKIKLRAGRVNADNKESILIGFELVNIPQKKYLPQGIGFDVSPITLEGVNDVTWLMLSRKTEGDLELFVNMIEDIYHILKVNALLPYISVYRLVIARIISWQNFMAKGCGGLSLEEELGLVGELHVLNKLLKNNLSSHLALASWKGPEGGTQDFELGDGSIEVKSTLSTSGFTAKIHSIDQLDDCRRQPLFLSGLYYTLASNGESLPSIVNYFRNKFLEDEILMATFEKKLSEVGYYDAHSEKYSRLFYFAKIKNWLVDDGFPRLIRGSIHNSINKVNYDIDLEGFSGEVLTFKKILTKLGV